MTDSAYHIDLTQWRCPQSLLQLKRALRHKEATPCRVRLREDSASDAQRWLTLSGCQWQCHKTNDHCIELSFYWDSQHA